MRWMESQLTIAICGSGRDQGSGTQCPCPDLMWGVTECMWKGNIGFVVLPFNLELCSGKHHTSKVRSWFCCSGWNNPFFLVCAISCLEKRGKHLCYCLQNNSSARSQASEANCRLGSPNPFVKCSPNSEVQDHKITLFWVLETFFSLSPISFMWTSISGFLLVLLVLPQISRREMFICFSDRFYLIFKCPFYTDFFCCPNLEVLVLQAWKSWELIEIIWSWGFYMVLPLKLSLPFSTL